MNENMLGAAAHEGAAQPEPVQHNGEAPVQLMGGCVLHHLPDVDPADRNAAMLAALDEGTHDDSRRVAKLVEGEAPLPNLRAKARQLARGVGAVAQVFLHTQR